MAAVEAKKSYKDGCVTVRVLLKSRGWQGDTAKIEGSTDLTSREARELAAALIDKANAADAKIKAKAEADARRQKWRDREIAAGRLKIMSLQDVLAK